MQKGQSGTGPGVHGGCCVHCGEKGSRSIGRCEVGAGTILGRAWKTMVRSLEFIRRMVGTHLKGFKQGSAVTN